MKALVLAALVAQLVPPLEAPAHPASAPQAPAPAQAQQQQARPPMPTKFPARVLDFWNERREIIAYLEALGPTEVQYCWKDSGAFKCFVFFHNGKAEAWGANLPTAMRDGAGGDSQ
jgi:hypothetical protein